MNDKIEAEQVIFYAAQDCAYTGTGAAQPWPPPVIGPAGALKSRRGPAVVVRRSCRSLFVQCRVPQYGWSQGDPGAPRPCSGRIVAVAVRRGRRRSGVAFRAPCRRACWIAAVVAWSPGTTVARCRVVASDTAGDT